MKRKIISLILVVVLLLNLGLKINQLKKVYCCSIFLEQSEVSSLNKQSMPIFTYANYVDFDFDPNLQKFNQVQLQLNKQFSALYNQILSMVIVLFILLMYFIL